MNMGRIGSNRTEYRINRIEPNQILIKKKDFGSNRIEYRLCRTEPDRIKKIPFVSASGSDTNCSNDLTDLNYKLICFYIEKMSPNIDCHILCEHVFVSKSNLPAFSLFYEDDRQHHIDSFLSLLLFTQFKTS